jgi:hypothetical protein
MPYFSSNYLAGRTPVTWLVGNFDRANQHLQNVKEDHMSHSNDLPPNPSNRDQHAGLPDPDMTDNQQQCIRSVPLPANVIELKPRSRRNFMTGAASLSCFKLTDGAAIRCSGLIALCEEFCRLERLSRDLWNGDDPTFWEQLLARQQALVARIKTRPPRSAAEFQALARALTGWFPGAAPFDIDDLFGSDCELLGVLIRGLLEGNAK